MEIVLGVGKIMLAIEGVEPGDRFVQNVVCGLCFEDVKYGDVVERATTYVAGVGDDEPVEWCVTIRLGGPKVRVLIR